MHVSHDHLCLIEGSSFFLSSLLLSGIFMYKELQEQNMPKIKWRQREDGVKGRFPLFMIGLAAGWLCDPLPACAQDHFTKLH